MKSHKVFS